MGWVDTLAVIGVVIFGLFIFYKALKEPADAFFALIRRGFESLRDKMASSGGGGSGSSRISYG